MAQYLSGDLLYLIFLHALPSTLISSDSPDDVWSIAPLNFSLVCRSWRTVDLSRSSLWNSIDIKFNPAKKPKPSFPRLVSNWLSRSSSAPLNIHLNIIRSGFKRSFAVDNAVNDELLDLVLRQYLRWNELQIIYGALKRDHPKQVMVKCALPVTSVELSFAGASYEPPEEPSVLLDLTPCTRTASINSQLRVLDVCEYVKWLLPEPRDGLHLLNLSELSFSTDLSGDIDDTLAVLSTCLNILTLHLLTSRQSRSSSLLASQNKNPTVALPLLTHFIFTLDDRPTSLLLLRRLACPSLRSFIVTSCSSYSSADALENFISAQDLNGFADFLSRTSFHLSLTDIELACVTIISPTVTESYSEHAAALRNLLSILNGLERLTIRGLAIENELFELMAVRTGDPAEANSTPLCPLLSEMIICLAENPGIQLESVEKMIVSRWKASRTLQHVAVYIPGLENLEEESERVRSCVDEGMTVTSRDSRQ